MVSGIDLLTRQESRVEARALFGSLLAYMNGPLFDPEATLELSVLERLSVSGEGTDSVSSVSVREVLGE